MLIFDRRQAAAVVSLMHGQHKEDFRVFVEALGTQAEKLNEKLINDPSENIKGLQGETRAYVDILRAIESAKDTANLPPPT